MPRASSVKHRGPMEESFRARLDRADLVLMDRIMAWLDEHPDEMPRRRAGSDEGPQRGPQRGRAVALRWALRQAAASLGLTP